MMKTLFVGGPKNGMVIEVKTSLNPWVQFEHEGKKYEYGQRMFEFVSREKNKQAWLIFLHGDAPAADEVYAMLKKSNLPPVFEGGIRILSRS